MRKLFNQPREAYVGGLSAGGSKMTERVYPTSDVQEEVGTAGIDLRTHCAIEFMKALIQVNARKDPKAAFELADSFLEVRNE